MDLTVVLNFGEKRKKKFILVVDDEQGRKLVRTALKDLGDIEILESDNARNALEITNKYKINLILTDIVLGNRDEIDFISTLRNSGRDTSVIFVSGQADKTLAIKALRLKAFDFIEKPFQND